ncbi:MAG: peroxiredoxin family protein, partial [Deltaproteobacteria bacterium]|nr:peroxiredoxin family protein [Deltaproteobacteria bacterium]
MKFFNKNFINIAILLIGLTVLLLVNEKPLRAGSEKGSIAPDFTLENVDGENVSLKDFRGSILVLGMVFGDKAAHDIEKYRERLKSQFNGKLINIL